MTHILVTRPLESSEQLAAQLRALGLQVIVMPLYTFSARQPGSDIGMVFSASRGRKLAVFTSPRAVRFGHSHIPAEQLGELEFAVVGSATRTELESSGYKVHLQASTGFTSEDLLGIPELANKPGKAVIFCAPGGRETLANGLGNLGWDVVNAMVYERLPLKPGPDQLGALSSAGELLSVWTSVSALTLARDSLPKDIWMKILTAPALVISARIQHHLQHQGAMRVELAEGPGNTELLKSIKRLTGR